jgi:putative acetyltransferase
VLNLTIAEESITTDGALAVAHAAADELQRRYGGSGDESNFELADLAVPRGLFLVARVDGELAGGVGLRAIGPSGSRQAEVKRLWVRPDLRRSGIAVALMADVVERGRAMGLRRLFLETGWAQPEAQALYPRIGWQRVDEFPDGAFTHPESTRFTMGL